MPPLGSLIKESPKIVKELSKIKQFKRPVKKLGQRLVQRSIGETGDEAAPLSPREGDAVLGGRPREPREGDAVLGRRSRRRYELDESSNTYSDRTGFRRANPDPTPDLPRPYTPPNPIDPLNQFANRAYQASDELNRWATRIYGTDFISEFVADRIRDAFARSRREAIPRNPPEEPPGEPSEPIVPIDPSWRDSDGILVTYGMTTVGNSESPGAAYPPPPNWVTWSDSAIVYANGQTFFVSALITGEAEDPELYYHYVSWWSTVGNLRRRGGRLNDLPSVTSNIGGAYGVVFISTPTGTWEPPTEETPPQEPPEIIILPFDPPLEPMDCDISPIIVALRQVIQAQNNLQANVNGTNLQINANIDTLKPPINSINTKTTQITGQVDDLSQYLTQVNQNISSRVDDVGGRITQVAQDTSATKTRLQNLDDFIRPKLDDIADGVRRTFDKVGETFGRIMDRFDKLARWLRLPLLFDALSLIVVLHNAAMLSHNLIQTLGQIIDTALDIIGLKDENDASFNISEILGKQASDFMKGIVGEATWTETTTQWKKLNDIYRAASQVIYSLQSIIDSGRSIMEFGAEMTGKIGNALRKAGVVFENAYSWFPENMNSAVARHTRLNQMISGVQSVDDTASALEGAVSEVKSGQDTINELKEQRQKLNEAITQLSNDKNTEQTTAKQESNSPTIQPTDLKSP
jgi:prefoldin subunit 5